MNTIMNTNMNMNMENFAHAPVQPVPLNIHNWIRSAEHSLSTNRYLKYAVDLSWMLVKHLMELVASAEIALSDIRVETVIIFVEPPPSLAIKAVRVQVVSQSGTSLAFAMSQAPQGARLLLSSRAVSAALGNILLEVFSKGRSSSPGTSSSSSNSNNNTNTSNNNSNCNENGHDGHDAIMPPSSRRRKVPAPAANDDNSMSAMVNTLLLEVGMPISIRRLVCDLMDAINEPCPDSALTSLEEVLWDLTRMKGDPQHFCFDRTCPQKALEDTQLFHSPDRHRLFGREKELGILMDAKKNIADHVFRKRNNTAEGEGGLNMDMMDIESSQHSTASFRQEIDFQCEMVFLSGYAGAGKSSLLRTLIDDCTEDGWFILRCKFEKQHAPIKMVARTFERFFENWATKKKKGDTVNREAFLQVCHSISSACDREGLKKLCEIVPSIRKILPDIATVSKNGHGHSNDDETSSSIEKVGAGKERRLNLFHVLFKAVCSAGLPVLLVYDDIQWAGAMIGMKEFITDYYNMPGVIEKGSCHHGLLVLGGFRTNEMGENLGVMENIASIEKSKSAKVTVIAIDELEQGDIMALLTAKLCLPLRYIAKLAALVLSKTRGNPFFIIQFLQTITRNGMLEFSVESRCWKWDCEVIEMQVISNGVAELLTRRFNELPDHLMRTLKIASCLGVQADGSIIDVLNVEQQVPFNMQGALKMAITEGLVEKAGPIYQFTHDVIHQTVYDSIPTDNRKLLHKTIGESLLKSAATNNPTIHLLAVDQINIYCKDGVLTPEERSQVASANATAAKFAIAESSFEQARSYTDVGIKMLDTNHWESQYVLSLNLFEMSASVSCMHGDIDTMSRCLNAIIANVKSFDDSLTSSSLLSKLLAASSKYDEAMENCLSVLSNLGEEFPEDITLQVVFNELAVIQTTLANITAEQVRNLPPMTDACKLNSMKFMSMLCMYGIQSKPLLVPILSCRMVRLTIEHGFCDDSIIGLVTAGFGLFSFADDLELGYRIGKVGESLIEDSQNMHALRARLCFELEGNLKSMVEPAHSVMALLPDRYNSAMLAGDPGSAMLSLLCHCLGCLHIGTELALLWKQYTVCIKQSTKYQQNAVLYLAMSSFGLCIFLSGRSNHEVDVKSYDELEQIGNRANLLILLNQNFMNQMCGYFWMRDFFKVTELSANHASVGDKRSLQVVRIFFEGIASLCLARHTRQPKWRKTGEDALEKMLKWEIMNKWNFEICVIMLQAELHYLNGDIKSADIAYKASEVCAQTHNFLHYEALAYELHGIFYVETGMVDRGIRQLQMALGKYEQWGAMRKVKDLRLFMDLIDPTYLRRKLKIHI